MAENTKNGDHRSIESAIDDEQRPNSSVNDNVDSSEMLTERLGFKSLKEKVKCSFEEELAAAEWSARSYTTAAAVAREGIKWRAVTGFPPLISSLKKNGRLRFSLVKVRENGGLQIWSVKNNRPEVYVERTPPGADHEEIGGGAGRVRVKFIDGNSSSGNEQ